MIQNLKESTAKLEQYKYGLPRVIDCKNKRPGGYLFHKLFI